VWILFYVKQSLNTTLVWAVMGYWKYVLKADPVDWLLASGSQPQKIQEILDNAMGELQKIE